MLPITPCPVCLTQIKKQEITKFFYFSFESVFLQRVQILALSPEGRIAHCKLGFFLFFGVGLYLDISLLYFLPIVDFFPQIAQVLGIVFIKH